MSSPIRPPLWITEADGNPSGRPINKIVVSNGTLTINGTTAEITTGGAGGGGTVTNVSSSDSFISITNPNTTPSITIQDATTSQDGILTSTDWNTFNNKTSNSGTVTSVGSSQAFVSVASATTTPSITIGDASGSATGVLTSTDWTTFNNKTSNTGTVTSVGSTQAFVSVASATTTPSITIGDASGSATGVLTSTDWTTFNNKTSNTGTVTSVGSTQAFVSVASATTTPSITIGDASGSATGVLTSTDWTTFNNKTSNTGTVTSVGSTQAFVSVASATTTPSITIGDASGSATGVLTSTDWTTFNNKQDSLTLTTTGSSGAATLTGSTLNIPQYGGGSVSFPLEGSSGSTSAPTYSFSADTDTGIFLGGASNMGLVAGGVSYINIGGLGIVELTRRLRNTEGSAALPSYSFSGDSDSGFWSSNPNEISLSLGGSRLFDFQMSGTSGKLQFRGSAPIVECDDANADLSLRSGGSTYAEILIQNENNNIDIKPAGTGKVKISNAYTLPSAVTTTNDYVLTAQTDGSTAWAASGGGGGGITWSTPVDSTLTPDTSATYDMGTSTVLFRSAYFSSTVNTGSINMTGNLVRPNGSLQITAGGSQDSRAHIFLPNNETNMKINGSSSSKTDIILDTRWNDASNTATIQLKTKGQTRFQVGADGELKVGSNAGDSGQVLTSAGANAAPTWSDAGGGSSYPVSMATAIGVNDDTFIITSFAPWPRSVLSTSSQSIDTSVYYIAFIPPKDITLTNLQVNITSAGTGNLSMALYTSDSSGNPKNLLSNSSVLIDASTTGYYTSTMASSQSLTGLTLYYLAITMSANSCQVRSHPTNSGWAIAPINGISTFNRALLYDGTTLTFPSTVTPSQLSTKYGFTPIIGGGF